MTIADLELGNYITHKRLARAVAHGLTPIVEVESQDGIYTVRLHHTNGVTTLADAEGNTLTFMGTGEIRDLLSECGLTHGILTWADQCGDEMIGVPGRALTPEEMLAYGTRISFC
jgi:hypothetical protein